MSKQTNTGPDEVIITRAEMVEIAGGEEAL